MYNELRKNRVSKIIIGHQHMPQFGTKEFNYLCEFHFSGKNREEL